MDDDDTWTLDGVPASEMIFWAELLDDPNPIHSDPEAARRLGFGNRTVNPGPVNLAYVMNLVAQAFDERPLSRITARFLGNVVSGDRVEAVLTERSASGGTARLTRDGGEAVLEADFTLSEEPGS